MTNVDLYQVFASAAEALNGSFYEEQDVKAAVDYALRQELRAQHVAPSDCDAIACDLMSEYEYLSY